MSSALTRRHLGGDPCCPLCYTSLESTALPFFECSRFVKIWEAEPFNIVLPRSQSNFVEWLRSLHSQLDKWVFTLTCVHGKADGTGGDIIEGAEHFMEAYRAAQFPRTVHGPCSNGIWCSIEALIIKVNLYMGMFEQDVIKSRL